MDSEWLHGPWRETYRQYDLLDNAPRVRLVMSNEMKLGKPFCFKASEMVFAIDNYYTEWQTFVVVLRHLTDPIPRCPARPLSFRDPRSTLLKKNASASRTP